MTLSVVSVTQTTFSSDATAHLVAMPTTVVAGELLVAFIAFDGAPTITTPTGWTATVNAPATGVRGTIYTKIALGTEGGTTVDFVTSVAEQAAAQVYRIQGNYEALGTGSVEFATVQSSASSGATTVDPNAITPTWGATPDTLYIAFLQTSATATFVSGPSGWGTVVSTNDGGGTAAGIVHTSAFGPNNTGSADAGVWTMSGTGFPYIVSTIAIRTKVGSVGLPVNTVVGTLTNAASVGISIPAVASGRILLIQSHARRPSTTLAPDDPTISDTSGSPLTWTAVYSTPPANIGANPSIKAQWWWAVSDGNAHNPVTIGYANAATIAWSVADFTVGAGLSPDFTNQTSGGNAGTGTAVTVTYPSAPTTGINLLSFFGAGGSASTIATGYTTLTFVGSSAYRTGYDITPQGNNGATMGASFPGQQLLAVNLVESSGATNVTVSLTGVAGTGSVGDVTVSPQLVSVTGVEGTGAVGTATVFVGTNVTVSVTGVEGIGATSIATVRTVTGNLLGNQLFAQYSSIPNPVINVFGGANVEVADLVFVTLAQETNLTAGACSDNLGNTYTAFNSGSDAGAITGRAYYSIVTNPGFLSQVSVVASASTNNAILTALPVQGPFTTIDANPANSVNVDLVAPYDGPATGSLAQADEFLVTWAMRPDTVNIIPVSPQTSMSSLSSGSLRSATARQVLSSASSVTPTWSSASDPPQIIVGVATFKINVGSINVTANVTGVAGTGAVGQVTVSPTLAPVSGVAGTGAVGTVTVSSASNVTAGVTGVAGTGSVGSVTISPQRVQVSGVSGTGAVGSVSVSAGGSVSVVPTGVSGTGAVGQVTVTAKQNITVVPTGVFGTGAVGDVTVTAKQNITVIPAGVFGTGAIGQATVFAAVGATAAPAGVSGTGFVGTATVQTRTFAGVNGVSAVGTAGQVSVTTTTVVLAQPKVWTGAAWAEKPAKVWNGTSWSTKPVKFWNGTAWISA
jgi:hypothetical protein